MNAYLMVAPGKLADGDHTVFVSGNDPAAKQTVTELLRSFGWKQIMDLGDVTTARGTKMMLPIWARVWTATGNPMFSWCAEGARRPQSAAVPRVHASVLSVVADCRQWPDEFVAGRRHAAGRRRDDATHRSGMELASRAPSSCAASSSRA